MADLHKDTLKEASRLMFVALGQQQPMPLPPVIEIPSPEGTSVPDQASSMPLPELPSYDAQRLVYETKRNDLIKFGAISLDKILTDKQYAGIRNDFGLNDPLYRAQINILDPASKKELEQANLRSIINVNSASMSERFTINQDRLDLYLTTRSEVSRQIHIATGHPANEYDNSMEKYEKDINNVFNMELAAAGVSKGPALYISYNENPHQSVTVIDLKDGRQAFVVNIEAWKSDPKAIGKLIHDTIKDEHYADMEQLAKLTNRNDVTLRDIFTKPEYEGLRKSMELMNFSGDNIKKLEGINHKLDKMLDVPLVKLLKPLPEDKKNIGAAVELLTVSETLKMHTLSHIEQIYEMDGVKNDDNKFVTLVESKNLKGDQLEFYKQFSAIAKRASFSKPAELYYRSYNTGGGAEATILDDGTPIVVVDKDYVNKPLDQALFVSGHEYGHQYNRDVFKGYKYGSEKSQLGNIYMELNADKFSAGKRGSCDPEAGIKLFQDAFSANNPIKYEQVVDSHLDDLAMGTLDHPLPPTRLLNMEYLAEHPSSACTPYYKPAKTPAQSH